MRALVIGLGRMGSWFARYLLSRGYSVDGYDIAEPSLKPNNVNVLQSPPSDIAMYDLIVSAVPVSASPDVALRVVNSEFKGVFLDVSSVKSIVNSVLRRASNRLTTVSIHPLFGPGAKTVEGKAIVLTPVKDVKKELEITSELFKGARIFVVETSEHDKLIAYVVTLPQILGYLFRSCSKEVEVKFKTSSFRLQEIASAVEADSPELACEILYNNPYSKSVIDELLNLMSRLKEHIGDKERLRLLLNELRGEWREWERLYELAYKVLDML